MNTIDLTIDPITAIIMVGIIGLIIGSFLNVVIARLPKMMERDWRAQCTEILAQPPTWMPPTIFPVYNYLRALKGQSPAWTPPTTSFNLVTPRSHCPHCGHLITAVENIPVLSYLWQRGRCTECRKTIALRYPLVEILSAILAVITAWHFGFNWQLGGALVFTWALLAASVIDYDHQLLPDEIILPMLWLGILCNLFGLYTDLESSVIGAMAGYMSLWTVFWIFKVITGKEGMGYGDFKLLAMLGAWGGWQGLLMVVFLSSLAGAIIGISLILWHQHQQSQPFAFGPYLAIAGWINLLWGTQIMEWYLTWQLPLSWQLPF